MAHSINNVQLIGKLGRDVEIKSTGSGQSVAILSLATTESWKDKKTGEWINDTEWHRIVFYGVAADAIASQNLKKGESLYVSGKIKTRKWTDDKQQERTIVEIIGDQFVPHRSSQGTDQQQQKPGSASYRQQQQRSAPQHSQQQQQNQSYPSDDDELF